MGSMKDQLGDNLPTIGDSRRQGMSTFSVHCGAPCGHVSKLTFDALRLPDETYFIDIPKRRRLRCSSCGRRATEISMSWNEAVLFGTGKRPVTGWVVVIRMPEGTEGRSSPMPSEDRAMGLAFDLADKGDQVLRIEGPTGNITGEQIAAARASRRVSAAKNGKL